MKRVFWGIFVILLLFVLAVGLSPYARLYQAKKSVEQGDVEPVLAMVDYQAVQAGVSKELQVRLDETMSSETFVFLQKLAPDMFADARTKLVGEIDKVTTKAITPDNLRTLSKGEVSEETKFFLGMWALSSNYVDFGQLIKDSANLNNDALIAGQLPNIQQKAQKRYGKPLPTKPVLSYCGYDCFYVVGVVKELPVGVYLYRDGLFNWKINKVELP